MKITKKSIEAITPTGHRQLFFDDELPGLAIRVSATGRVSFYFTYRAGRGRGAVKNWHYIGAYPAWTPEQARQKVKELAAQVINGQDPVKERQETKAVESETPRTLAGVFDLFLADCQTRQKKPLKPKSLELYEGAIKKHVLPVFGKKKVEEITSEDIEELHKDLGDEKGIPYMANRVAAILSKFWNWAGKKGYCKRGSNPVKGLEKYEEKPREDFLSADESAALWSAVEALEKSGSIFPLPAAALRLLMVSGMRLMEVLSLKWEYLDFEAGTASLPGSKTGFKVVPLTAPALDVLKAMTHYSEFVFPSATSKTGHIEGLRKPWELLQKRAGLKEHWRIHDLRHGFASRMLNTGASLPTVGKILGHKSTQTTARYAHMEISTAQKAADVAAQLITEGWNKAPADSGVIPFRPRRAGG